MVLKFKLTLSLFLLISILLLYLPQVCCLDDRPFAGEPTMNIEWKDTLQPTDEFRYIDMHAINAPNSAKRSIQSLASYLTKPAKNDRERVRAIYRWIAENIDYDTKGFFQGIHENSTPEGVLKSGKSVCNGYSNLFESLANASGVETVTISGYAKGFNYTPGMKFVGPTNHAWNAVKLDGRWQLIDSTWGAGIVDDGGKFIRKFDDHFFLTPPEEFIYRHFPEDPKWQLLAKPITKEQFEDLVYLDPGFFDLGLGLGNQRNITIISSVQANITLYAPEDVSFMAELNRMSKNVSSERIYGSPVLVRRAGEQYVIKVLPPSPGDYILRVFGKNVSDVGSYEDVMEYKIVELSGSKSSFPIVFDEFFDLGMRMNNQTNGTIEARGWTNLSLYAPLDVLIMANLEKLGRDDSPSSKKYGEPTFIKRSGDHYELSILPPSSGEYILTIFAKRKDEGNSYHEVLQYNVTAPFGSNRSFPAVYDRFYDLGLRLNNYTNGNIEANGKANLSIYAPPDILMMASLEKLNGSGNPYEEERSSISLQRSADLYDIEILPPTPGAYVLTVFAKHKEDPNSYQGVLRYNVSASSGSEIVFPETFGDFQEKGVYLYSPLTGNLKEGLNQTFKLIIPGAEEAAIISGKDWYPLTKSGDLFQGEVVLRKGEINVGAKYPGKANYIILVRYRGV